MTDLPSDEEVSATWQMFEQLSKEVMRETGRPVEITKNQVNWFKFFEDCLTALKCKESRIHELEGRK